MVHFREQETERSLFSKPRKATWCPKEKVLSERQRLSIQDILYDNWIVQYEVSNFLLMASGSPFALTIFHAIANFSKQETRRRLHAIFIPENKWQKWIKKIASHFWHCVIEQRKIWNLFVHFLAHSQNAQVRGAIWVSRSVCCYHVIRLEWYHLIIRLQYVRIYPGMFLQTYCMLRSWTSVRLPFMREKVQSRLTKGRTQYKHEYNKCVCKTLVFEPVEFYKLTDHHSRWKETRKVN